MRQGFAPAARQALPQQRYRRGDPVQPQAAGANAPVSRRWPPLPCEPPRRARSMGHRDGAWSGDWWPRLRCGFGHREPFATLLGRAVGPSAVPRKWADAVRKRRSAPSRRSPQWLGSTTPRAINACRRISAWALRPQEAFAGTTTLTAVAAPSPLGRISPVYSWGLLATTAAHGRSIARIGHMVNDDGDECNATLSIQTRRFL